MPSSRFAMLSAVVTATLLGAIDIHASPRLTPLSEVPHGVDQMPYFAKRCASLMLLVNHNMDDEEAKIKTIESYEFWRKTIITTSRYAAHRRKSSLFQKDIDNLLLDVEKIYILYQDEMSENYLRTGNQVSDLIRSDLESCVDVFELYHSEE